MIDNSKRRIAIWLFTGCFLIFSMVVIGGITRLTGSGLSITEWNVIMGAIPPLNESEWQDAFEKYQQIPQFQKVNSHFELSDFKSIFLWEYLHRLVGRLIGIVFLIPFLWFVFTRQMDRATIRKSLFLFALGALQGFLGWFMVKSGLTERTSVSHIRLAIHLMAAFITFGFTFWYALELVYPSAKKNVQGSGKILKVIFVLLLIQIVYGAFVAGMHAGKIYNTWPLMDGQFIPSGILSGSSVAENLINNQVMVQFLHRVFAIIILGLVAVLWNSLRKKTLTVLQRRGLNFILLFVVVQFLLGIFTLLSGAEITLASLHQIGAFLLFSATIFLMYQFNNATQNRT
ncbi:MAG TPA: COX15/CtaA family protein [Bacteroidia bacterium]|nr:COX15/CtaA family protein [Bacteroidia bacterium]